MILHLLFCLHLCCFWHKWISHIGINKVHLNLNQQLINRWLLYSSAAISAADAINYKNAVFIRVRCFFLFIRPHQKAFVDFLIYSETDHIFWDISDISKIKQKTLKYCQKYGNSFVIIPQISDFWYLYIRGAEYFTDIISIHPIILSIQCISRPLKLIFTADLNLLVVGPTGSTQSSGTGSRFQV